MKTTVRHVVEAVRRLGLSGYPLCVHSSLRSFRWVEGGATAVVEGLLSEGCTVMVPAFSWTFAVPPPPTKRPARNGWNYDNYKGPTSGIGRVYTPNTMEIDKDMGAIPAAVVAMPQRIRGNHPLCSFTAVGPLASELISGQGPLTVYAPLKQLAEKRGSIILMGVGLKSMTLIHLAEQMAGRILFRRWANGPDGRPMQVETGGCSSGSHNFEQILSPLVTKTSVGKSVWRVYPAEYTLEAAARAIRKDPWITHCNNPDCSRCNDAVMGGPILQ